ncbi:MAG: c-type cytochrome [Hyphomicrobiaceae bacterium]
MKMLNVRGLGLFLCASSLFLAVPVAARAQDDAEGDDRALTEYEISCMDCHGPNGRGDGPMAPTLSKRPADLTKIAKANNGVFPEKRIREMIDGRAMVASHGVRDMPVWGARYRNSPDPDDKPSDVDKRARVLIDQLVEFLKSIQEK